MVRENRQGQLQKRNAGVLRCAQNDESFAGYLCCADFNDAGAEFFRLFDADAADGFELSDGLGADEDDAAEGGGAEDEELGEAEFFGFGFAPFAEALVEGLLFGGEGFWFGCGGAGASEGFGGLGCFWRGNGR